MHAQRTHGPPHDPDRIDDFPPGPSHSKPSRAGASKGNPDADAGSLRAYVKYLRSHAAYLSKLADAEAERCRMESLERAMHVRAA